MKEIKILKLKIDNFKKIQSFDVDLNGENINLYGKNGTGKSSIFDAFSWCLFGKDSSGSSNFSLKPYDPITKEEIHNINPTVELTLSVDGGVVKLKRVYKEVWTKKRNDNEATFTGHETEYFVNDVPKLQKEYKAVIDEVITEELFKMITNLHYFVNLNWQTQRNELEKLVSISELDIIKDNKELKPLENELLLGRTVEDVIKIQAQKQKTINQRLGNGLPSEISALKNIEYALITDDFKQEASDLELDAEYKKLSEIEKQLATGNNQFQIADYDKTILSLENDIQKLENEKEILVMNAKKDHQKKVMEEESRINKLDNKITTLTSNINYTKSRIEAEEKNLDGLATTKEILYQDYDEAEERSFKDTKCVYCEQELPAGKLEEAKNTFNLVKSRELEEIKKRGQALNIRISDIQGLISQLRLELERLHNELAEAQIDKGKFSKALISIQGQVVEVDTKELDAKIEKLLERKATVEKARKEIANQQSNVALLDAKKVIQSKIENLNGQKAEYTIKLQNQKKVTALEEEQKKLNTEFEVAKNLINLGEKFRMLRAERIDQDVNKHFELVKFKLFNVLINGGIEPTCIATLNGVPYQSISYGEKINVGLDIINGIQKIYNVIAPVFIDNAESVSDWLVDTSNSQIIMMIVDPKVEKLEVEEA